MWQEAAFAEWRERLEERLPDAAGLLVDTFDQSAAVHWLRRMNRDAHPVAAGIGHWLSSLDTRPWLVAPADDWDIAEGADTVLVAYPEYLGWDPLAMCGIGAVWAGAHGPRWHRLVDRLGPVSLLGAREGRVDYHLWEQYLSSFGRAYRPYLERWYMRPEVESGDDTIIWPAVPHYQDYREQLIFGVVPHEPGGEGVHGETAVLLALSEMADDARSMMAGLAYKALEGLWLTEAWRKVR